MSNIIAIFDMDGTLIDSAHDITASVNYVRATLSLAPLTSREVVDAINKDQRNLAYIFYHTKEYLAQHKKLFEEHYYYECTKNVYAYPTIVEALEGLLHKGVRLSVATNAPTIYAKRMLQHVNIARYFDYIFAADVFVSKPDPMMLNEILKRYAYSATKDKAYMIGDNNKDMQAARNAHINAVFAAWGFSNERYDNSLFSPLDLVEHLT